MGLTVAGCDELSCSSVKLLAARLIGSGHAGCAGIG